MKSSRINLNCLVCKHSWTKTVKLPMSFEILNQSLTTACPKCNNADATKITMGKIKPRV